MTLWLGTFQKMQAMFAKKDGVVTLWARVVDGGLAAKWLQRVPMSPNNVLQILPADGFDLLIGLVLLLLTVLS